MKGWRVAGAGAFVVLGTLLFTAALFLIGERRNLFTDRFTVYAEFTRLAGLQVGASVRVAGLDAGEVKQIDAPPGPSSKFRVKLEIREDLHQLVRTDSVATLQTEGLVGGMFVQVTVGTDTARRAAADSTIQSRDPFELADLMQQASDTLRMMTGTVESLRGDIEKAVENVALTAEDAHALFEDIRPDIQNMARKGNRIASDASAMIEDVRAGRGTIGKLVTDDQLYRDITDVTRKARDVAENVREVSAQARGAVGDLRQKGGQASGVMSHMQQTLTSANEAIGDLADNMEALKRNFFFRGFFKERGYFDLDTITPSEYRAGMLEAGGGRKALRVWLGAAVLFSPEGDGATLTDDGKARLDSAMTPLLPFVAGAPFVVEGYDTSGSGLEQYRRSRARASAVRMYLMSRFPLRPTATGAMALGPEAPQSPTGDVWDGVALAVFVPLETLRGPKATTSRR